jgi:hypothetical protein
MKKKMMTTTLVLAGVAVITIPAMAAQPTWEGSRRSRNLANPVVLEAHADALGMTPEELRAELESGKRMREILEENGVKPDFMRDTVHERFIGPPPKAPKRGMHGPGLQADVMAAKADLLGMTVEDLTAAIESGQCMRDILSDRNMDAHAFHKALAEKYPDLKFGHMRGRHAGHGWSRQ